MGSGIFYAVNELDFSFNCAEYLKRAADANTIEMAKPELNKAIEYLEYNNLTSGVVSVFLKNPKNDIGFFYENLKASQAELEKANPEISQLEESNLLMKLRETLMDEGETVRVTYPAWISIYPDNVAFFWWTVINLIAAVGFGWIIYSLFNNGEWHSN